MPILLAIIGCLPAIAGWDSVNLFVQERDINFKSLVMRTIASKAAALPVMLAWAAFDRSVWALAAGAISAQLILAISSHFMVPGGPMKLSWNTTHIKDIFGDGKWITLSSATGIVSSQGDRLVLAAILTAQQMGLYAVAWALADVLRAFVQRLDGQITLPVLSELYRTKPAAAKAAYYRYRMPIDIFTFGAAAFLCFAGPDIVNFLYDDRYRGAGWVLQVLGLSLAPIPFRMINQAFIANGEWRGFSVNSAFLSVSLVGAIAAGYYFAGWAGAVWGVSLHSWPATLTLLVRAHRRGWIDPLREISMIPAALLGLTLGLVAHWVLPWAGTLI